jgi:hypothetical protein
VYVTYNGFLAPWRNNLTDTRPFQGVVRHADFGSLGSWTDLYRGTIGDARASSANSLVSEFLGYYNFIDAANSGAVAVWNDARNAAVCSAVDDFRAYLAGVGPQAPAPTPGSNCDATFGNTDIFSGVFPDPTP